MGGLSRISTNVSGLDEILRGGVIAGRTYLVYGTPGTGKTTLGVHFLSNSDRALLITFAEAEEQLRSDAAAVGINIDRVAILDLTPVADVFVEKKTYDIFSPGEVERETVAQQIVDFVEKNRPERLFVDGFSLFRNLASDIFHYHRLVQSFFRYATGRGCTVLVASDEAAAAPIVDGIIQLEFGREGRWISVTKFRGSDFHAGPHPMRLTGSGIQVLPNAA